MWNSVTYWFIYYACTCQGFIHLKNSRYLNASEKRIKLSTRNINFVGWNLFHEKYKMHIHVTAVKIFVHILIFFFICFALKWLTNSNIIFYSIDIMGFFFNYNFVCTWFLRFIKINWERKKKNWKNKRKNSFTFKISLICLK